MDFSNSRRRTGSSGRSSVAGGATLTGESSCGAGICADRGGDRNALKAAIRMTEFVFRIVAGPACLSPFEVYWRLRNRFGGLNLLFRLPRDFAFRNQFQFKLNLPHGVIISFQLKIDQSQRQMYLRQLRIGSRGLLVGADRQVIFPL